MKLKSTMFIFFLLTSFSSLSYEKEIDKFFHLYESGKVTEAVDSIYSTNKWVNNKADDVQKVKNQLQNLKNLVGKYHGKVKFGTENLEGRLVYISYLAMFERQPVRLEFVFYRPKEAWVIYSFSFDDTIDDELVDYSRKKIVGSAKGS
ncbi:hypothetical protein KJY73_12815 [Bowmanella sp. Y26]|uniref:hypothetical protein n=1 Tax=Bowmanella yangjiangensis TaxID=2811230 RepID=UPI001BDD93A8|nr:hypothetical protein [Bowmanella yangjiangensis]MBT1064463.1 hypothetical protein [Bowmanella yangjiangensis]